MNNIDYDDSDYEYFKGMIPPGVKSVSFYTPEKYNMKELIQRKIEIRSINCRIKRIEIPSYQTKLNDNAFFGCSELTNVKLNKQLILTNP